MLNLLAAMPIWFTFAVLFFLCIGILPLGRRYFERFPYNIALSSAYGIVALIVCVMIGVTVLQRAGAPEWLYRYQFVSALLSIGMGIFSLTVIAGGIKRNTVMDTYHNLVVVPILVYLVLFTAVPLIVTNGSTNEKLALILFEGFVFGMTFIYDFFDGRLRQTKWLRERGRVTQV